MIETIIAHYLLGVFVSFIIIAAEWEKHSKAQKILNVAMSWGYILAYILQESINLIKQLKENK